MNLPKDWFELEINTNNWTITVVRTSMPRINNWRLKGLQPQVRKSFIDFGAAMFGTSWKCIIWRLPRTPTSPETRRPRSMCRRKSGWGLHIPDLFLLRDQDSCKGTRDLCSKVTLNSQLHQLWVKWSRDKNAARNIRNVAFHMVSNNDRHPVQFKRGRIMQRPHNSNTCRDKPQTSYTCTNISKHISKASLQ